MTPAWIVYILLAAIPACICGSYWLGYRMCLEQQQIDAEPPRGPVALDFGTIADTFTQLTRRGGARFQRDGEAFEVRVESLGGDPERFGLSRSSLDLVLGIEEVRDGRAR